MPYWEFFNTLCASGLEKNSLELLYGAHFGISNDRKLTLAPLLGMHARAWNGLADAQLQRVPLIFHMPGLMRGEHKLYGGEIAVHSTHLHLLGISSCRTVQFGLDLLSNQQANVVAFRNHNFVTPCTTVLGSML